MTKIEITEDALMVLEEHLGPDYATYSDVILAMHAFSKELAHIISRERETRGKKFENE